MSIAEVHELERRSITNGLCKMLRGTTEAAENIVHKAWGRSSRFSIRRPAGRTAPSPMQLVQAFVVAKRVNTLILESFRQDVKILPDYVVFIDCLNHCEKVIPEHVRSMWGDHALDTEFERNKEKLEVLREELHLLRVNLRQFLLKVGQVLATPEAMRILLGKGFFEGTRLEISGYGPLAGVDDNYVWEDNPKDIGLGAVKFKSLQFAASNQRVNALLTILRSIDQFGQGDDWSEEGLRRWISIISGNDAPAELVNSAIENPMRQLRKPRPARRRFLTSRFDGLIDYLHAQDTSAAQ